MNQTDYFTEKIATLPEDLQDAIRASNHEGVLKDIQREYKLHIDQAQVLETLAMQLIFGDIDAPTFVSNMFNEAHVSSSVAGDILLKIDTLILRKIRSDLEAIAEAKKKDEELKKLLMDDEESLEDDKANMYAAYYADVANILKETEEEMLKEGILPDGSNITDEMIAKELGITPEEFSKQNQVGAFKEANEKTNESPQTQKDILSEKEELLHELESPEKSFVKPLFTPVTTPIQESKTVTLPDHQLQNTHIEIPYTETEDDKKEKPVEKPIIATADTANITNIKNKPVTVIKKPTKLVLSNDPYKEPIE